MEKQSQIAGPTALYSFSMRKVFFILVCLVVISCKRQGPTNWDTEWLAPVAVGFVRPLDVIDEDDLAIDANGVAHVIIEDEVPLDALDDLANLPDTTISNGYTFGTPGGPFTLPAGFSFVSDNEGFDLNPGQALLRTVVFKEGALKLQLRSDVDGELAATVSLPSATLEGVPLSYATTMAPGTAANPTFQEIDYDLAGYTLDLTGENGDEANRLLGNINVSTVSSTDVFGTDSVIANFSFQDVVVDYALGYFGQYNETFDQNELFGGLEILQSGGLTPEQIDISLEISNPVGIDLVLNLDELSLNPLDDNAADIPLDHALVEGGIQLSRAFDNNGTPEFATGLYSINEGNSNITSIIASSPNGVQISGDVEINPLGDISGGNDFYYADFPLQAKFGLDLPLCIDFDALVFQDTVALNVGNLEGLQTATLFVEFESNMPIEIGGRLWINDAEGEEVVLIEDLPIAASSTGLFESQSQEIVLSIDDVSALEQAEEVYFEALINSEGENAVKLRETDEVRFKLRGKFGYELEY